MGIPVDIHYSGRGRQCLAGITNILLHSAGSFFEILRKRRHTSGTQNANVEYSSPQQGHAVWGPTAQPEDHKECIST